MAFESDQQEDRLPVRIRRGHRQDCPKCNHTGRNLIDHLKENHTDVVKRYERSSRGVWVLDESGGKTNDGDSRKDDAEAELEEVRGELREKDRRIAELEARLEEKRERIEELKETRDRLTEVAEEALAHLPEDASTEKVKLRSDGGYKDT